MIKDRFFSEKSKPESVLLWGSGPVQEVLKVALVDVSVSVRSVNDCNYEAAQSAAVQGIPTIVTTSNSEGELCFDEDFESLVKNCPEGRILHPVSAFSWIRFSLSECCIVNGYPSSGNRVWSYIIRKLRAMSDFETTDLIRARQSLSKHADDWIKTCLNNEIEACARGCRAIPNRARYADANYLEVGNSDAYVSLEPVPSLELFYKGFRPGHFRKGGSGWDWLRDRGCKNVFFSRDPLDTVISLSAKFWFMDQERGLIDEAEDVTELRQAIAFVRLSDEQWFKSTLQSCIELMEDFILQNSSSHVARYENLLENPVENIVALSEYLGTPVDRKMAKKLWNKFGMKPLGKYQIHYNQPAARKWEKRLWGEHVTWIEELLGDRAGTRFSNLGYVFDYNMITGERPEVSSFAPGVMERAVDYLRKDDANAMPSDYVVNDSEYARVYSLNESEFSDYSKTLTRDSVRSAFSILWGWGEESGFNGRLHKVESQKTETFSKPCSKSHLDSFSVRV